VQLVQELTLEAVEKLEAEEDAWLLAFFRGAPASLSPAPCMQCSVHLQAWVAAPGHLPVQTYTLCESTMLYADLVVCRRRVQCHAGSLQQGGIGSGPAHQGGASERDSGGGCRKGERVRRACGRAQRIALRAAPRARAL
jgi:hypothetical protein